MTFHQDLLEVTFTGIITRRFEIHRQKCICKGIMFPVRINIYLKASFHFFIVFQKDMCIMEHLVVIDIVSWTIKTTIARCLQKGSPTAYAKTCSQYIEVILGVPHPTNRHLPRQNIFQFGYIYIALQKSFSLSIIRFLQPMICNMRTMKSMKCITRLS